MTEKDKSLDKEKNNKKDNHGKKKPRKTSLESNEKTSANNNSGNFKIDPSYF